MDPVVHWILRAGLALLFGAAALHKLRDRERFAATLRDYRVLPEGVVAVAATAIPAAEVGVAASLVVPALAAHAALAGAVLLAVYSAAIGANLARGRRHIDCGCLGPRGREPISAALVARNAALAGACLATAWLPHAARSLAWVDALSIAGGVTVVALLFHATQQLAVHWARPGAAR